MPTLSVSTAKLDITPTLAANPYIGGYSLETPRQATRVYSRLYARCIVIWDDGVPSALVVADVLLFPRSVHQAIRQQVITLNNAWSTSNFMLGATHTHNGPVLVEIPDPFITYGLTDLTLVNSYTTWLVAQITGLVQTTLGAEPQPCTLDYQVATASFAANREGLTYVETDVPVLVARADDQPLAVIFSYGCHPVSAGTQLQLDGDFPAGACSVIEASIPGAFALFLQGPAGDQDPTGGRGWPLRNQLSAQLGSIVVTAAGTPGRPVTGPIDATFQEISLPLDVPPVSADLAPIETEFAARQANAGLLPMYRRHAQVMIEQIHARTYETTVPLPLQVWKLQGSPMLRIAFVGGEPVSGYGATFRNQYGGSDNLLFGGYAGEVPSYIPTDEFLPPVRNGGSYDGGWDPDFPDIAGGSQTVYGFMGHYLAGAGGVESTLTDALSAQLS